MNEEKSPTATADERREEPDGSSLTSMTESLRDVPIRDESIRLGQFLKLADLIDTGSDAKAVIAAGEVLVNDEVDVRRGRQLHPGDTVTIGERTVQVTRA